VGKVAKLYFCQSGEQLKAKDKFYPKKKKTEIPGKIRSNKVFYFGE